MGKIEKYDVVIVGAGPSGSILSYELAQHGIRVLLIDKKKFPRNKACAGGLTRRAMSVVPFDLDGIIEDYTYTAKMLIKNKVIYNKTFDEPIIGMVMRKNFDNMLVNKAIEAGVIFQDGTSFKSLYGKPGDISVETSKGCYSTKIIVGADGVKSRVARALNFNLKGSFMTAVEGEVYLKSTKALDELKGSVHYDFDVIPEGYGWIFPKKDHLSMGIVSISPHIRGWKSYFESYLKLKGKFYFNDIIDYRGHLIPFRSDKRNVFADHRGMVVGDATGYTDPLTGEGIYYAVKSALMAVDPIVKGLSQGCSEISAYNKIIKDAFHKDLSYANWLSLILYKLPSFSYRILAAQSERFGKNQIKVITGEQTYEALFKKIFNMQKLMKVIANK